MEKMSGGGLRKGQESHGAWERPGPHCSREATMFCFRAHLRNPQAVLFTGLHIYGYLSRYNWSLPGYLTIMPTTAFPGRPSPAPVLNTAFLPPASVSD